jgi:hypothetical protein
MLGVSILLSVKGSQLPPLLLPEDTGPFWFSVSAR